MYHNFLLVINDEEEDVEDCGNVGLLFIGAYNNSNNNKLFGNWEALEVANRWIIP